jgi:RadC-like JAB domain
MSLDRQFLQDVRYSVPQLKLYLVQENNGAQRLVTVRTPMDAARLLEPLRHAPEEHFVAIHLNAKHEVIGLHEVSHGTLSASLVHPREVFKAALVANSFAILVCHNHPSGSTLVPSSEDLATTKQLLQAGKVLGVAVIDHLIVGFRNFIKAPIDSKAGGLMIESESSCDYEAGKDRTDANFVYSFRENYPQLWSN